MALGRGQKPIGWVRRRPTRWARVGIPVSGPRRAQNNFVCRVVDRKLRGAISRLGVVADDECVPADANLRWSLTIPTPARMSAPPFDTLLNETKTHAPLFLSGLTGDDC